MNDEAAFVAAIAAAPDDQQLPLIFADWLDDHGDALDARTASALAKAALG